MLDVAGKEYVAKEAEEGEEEEEEEQEPVQQLEEVDEEEEVMVVAAGGDYSDLMKKMDITACTVIVPKVSDSDKQYFRTGFSRLLDPDPGS